MKKVFFGVLFLIMSFGVFAQNHIQHTVVKDDTVYSLARKYGVTIHDIYTLNPGSKEEIKLGEVLLIPRTEKNSKLEKKDGIYHKVQPKETLFGLAQQYGTTIQAIQEANKDLLVNGLQIDMEIRIPTGKKVESSTTIIKNNDIIHIVLPKETKFALTQKYGVSEEELVAQNPHIKAMLREGDTVRIALKGGVIEEKKEEKQDEKPKEEIAETISKKDFKELKIKNSDKKNVVIMLPFRATKIANAQESFKTDRFLNATIDFYSGALMAIEDIKRMGGNLNITFYDSEEVNPGLSSVENLIKTKDFSDVDVVIGPFFQSHTEKAASLLESKNVLVVSPLSIEGKAKYKNLYFATPPTEVSRKIMLEYLKEKNQNTVAIVDRKKSSARGFIANNYNGIQFVGFNEKGEINTENLKSLLDKDKMNYVILETESTSMVLNAVNTLSKLKEVYKITLVALDRNEAFESDEIKSQALADLNLHYPSSMNESTDRKTGSFYSDYKSKNNVFPSAPAVKGYDVVYDVLLRLSQDDDFSKVADKFATQQLESKFIYTKSPDGGYYNTGVYILYYDEDLSIKEAK